jgi:uncharacterized membrane protein (DUF373 family)
MNRRLSEATPRILQPSTHETTMIRMIALATVLGVLVASMALYAVTPPKW